MFNVTMNLLATYRILSIPLNFARQVPRRCTPPRLLCASIPEYGPRERLRQTLSDPDSTPTRAPPACLCSHELRPRIQVSLFRLRERGHGHARVMLALASRLRTRGIDRRLISTTRRSRKECRSSSPARCPRPLPTSKGRADHRAEPPASYEAVQWVARNVHV